MMMEQAFSIEKVLANGQYIYRHLSIKVVIRQDIVQVKICYAICEVDEKG